MKYIRMYVGLFFSIVSVSCISDDTLIEDEQILKFYELTSIQWKLNPADGQSIVEKILAEYHFRNDSDTTMEVVIEPLKDLEGSSLFAFNDSLTFTELNYAETQVSIPNELSLLSEEYSYLGGGVIVPLTQDESSFPFSNDFTDSFSLNKRSMMTSNYTVFLSKNTASFLATFRETSTGETIEMDGSWTGLFFNSLDVKTVIEDID